MRADLLDFLAGQKPIAEETEAWGGGTLPLRARGYLTSDQPPDAYVTSVRALVFKDQAILVIRDPNGSPSIAPGGRRDGRETFEETLRREVPEETGWTLGDTFILGFVHYHHLGPRPQGYAYPYPDFVQVVYRAEATSFVPDAMQADDYVISSAFHAIEEVQQLDLSSVERAYLEAALALRRRQ